MRRFYVVEDRKVRYLHPEKTNINKTVSAEEYETLKRKVGKKALKIMGIKKENVQ